MMGGEWRRGGSAEETRLIAGWPKGELERTNECMDGTWMELENKLMKTETGNGAKTKSTGRLPTNKKYAKTREEDVMEVSLLCAYIIQQRGGATNAELVSILREQLRSIASSSMLHHVLEMLRKKDILAATNTGGSWVYTLKRLKFNSNIEIAQLGSTKGIINTLYDDPAGLAIKANIESAIAAKEPKKVNKPQDWAVFEVKFRLLTPWLGAQPIEGNEYLSVCYGTSPFKLAEEHFKDPKSLPLVFERDAITGELLIHRSCVRGFIKTHLSQAGRSEFNVDLFGVQEIRVKPEKPLTVVKKPIQRQGVRGNESSGAGFAHYETLFPGEELMMKFTAPTKNFLTPKQLEKWLRVALEYPTRSMSPARGVETGSAELLTCTHTLLSIAKIEDSEGSN